MKRVAGTGICVDFPTSKGHIYTRKAIVEAISDKELLARLKSGSVMGSIVNEECDEMIDMYTHQVNGIYLYKDELVVEYTVLETQFAKKAFEMLKTPEAVIIMFKASNHCSIIDKIDPIKTVHLREKKVYVPSHL